MEGFWPGPVPSPAPIIRVPVRDPPSNGLIAARAGIGRQIYSIGFITSTERCRYVYQRNKNDRLRLYGGSTPAYYDAAAGVWKRKSTTWLTVKAFRTLAVNALACLHKGDPVMVTGSLVTEEWTTDGQPHSSLVLIADGIGHDLARGQDTFTRIRSSSASIDEGAAGPDPWTTPLASSPSETASASPASSAPEEVSVEAANAG